MSLITFAILSVVAVAIGGGIWGVMEGEVVDHQVQRDMSGVAWEEITNKTHDCWTWIWNRDAQIGYCEETSKAGTSSSEAEKDKFFVYADFSRKVSNRKYTDKIFKYSFIDSVKYDKDTQKLELKLNDESEKVIRITRKERKDKATEMKEAWEKKMQKRNCTLWAKSSDEFIGICNRDSKSKQGQGSNTAKKFLLYAEFNEKFEQGMSKDKILKSYEVNKVNSGDSSGVDRDEIVIHLKDGRVKTMKREKKKDGSEHTIKEEMTLEWGPKDRVGAAVKALSGAGEVKSDNCSQGRGILDQIGIITCKGDGQRDVKLPMRRIDWRFAAKRK